MPRKAAAVAEPEEEKVKSLGEWFEELTEQGYEPEDLVWEATTQAEPEALIPAVRNYYAAWERNHTRADEEALHTALEDAEVTEKAPAKKGEKKRRVVDAQAPVKRHLGLLGRSFYNGTQKVRYADATAADLEARIEYLDDKIAGYARTVALTKKLITMMKRSKVDTLGQINPESLAKVWAEMKDAGEIA